MESILQWGLDFIRVVQSIASPCLTFIMKSITAIGREPVYLAFSFFYWCIDEKKGVCLGFAVFISMWVNLSLKYLLNQPRPFFEGYDPSLAMAGEEMGGLPSGHAQNTLVLLFIIASWLKNKLSYVCAAFLCLLIGFSRIYLGVHFPTDVFAGWILGGVIFCGYFFFGNKIEELLVKGGFRAAMIATAALSFIMILYLPGKELLVPGGVILGLGTGYCLNKRYVGFSSRALFEMSGFSKYIMLFARIVLGYGVFLLVFFTFGKSISQNAGSQNLYGFILTALAGLWVSVAAPWVFIKLRLAKAV
jgi:membrane-associated phospholipid phosphatase